MVAKYCSATFQSSKRSPRAAIDREKKRKKEKKKKERNQFEELVQGRVLKDHHVCRIIRGFEKWNESLEESLSKGIGKFC